MTLKKSYRGYKPVPESQDSPISEPEESTDGRNILACIMGLNVLLFVLSFCCLLISIGFWRLENSGKGENRPDIIYSPAHEAEEFQAVRFDGALDSANVYKGTPNPELDYAWQDLYEYDPFLVTTEDLRKIDKTSMEIPTRPGYHLAKLAVHHQLHCLDYIRRFTRPEYYNIDESMFQITTIDHVDHCIDMLRQFIQCKADTTLITFDWEGAGTPTQPNFCSTHGCNNFGKVNEWAKSRQFNMTAELEAQQKLIEDAIEEEALKSSEPLLSFRYRISWT